MMNRTVISKCLYLRLSLPLLSFNFSYLILFVRREILSLLLTSTLIASFHHFHLYLSVSMSIHSHHFTHHLLCILSLFNNHLLFFASLARPLAILHYYYYDYCCHCCDFVVVVVVILFVVVVVVIIIA